MTQGMKKFDLCDCCGRFCYVWGGSCCESVYRRLRHSPDYARYSDAEIKSRIYCRLCHYRESLAKG